MHHPSTSNTLIAIAMAVMLFTNANTNQDSPASPRYYPNLPLIIDAHTHDRNRDEISILRTFLLNNMLTGPGLSLSYDIIKAHFGAVQVETIKNEFPGFKIPSPI